MVDTAIWCLSPKLPVLKNNNRIKIIKPLIRAKQSQRMVRELDELCLARRLRGLVGERVEVTVLPKLEYWRETSSVWGESRDVGPGPTESSSE